MNERILIAKFCILKDIHHPQTHRQINVWYGFSSHVFFGQEHSWRVDKQDGGFSEPSWEDFLFCKKHHSQRRATKKTVLHNNHYPTVATNNLKVNWHAGISFSRCMDTLSSLSSSHGLRLVWPPHSGAVQISLMQISSTKKKKKMDRSFCRSMHQFWKGHFLNKLNLWMNAALSPASALDSKGASASATTCSQAIIAPPALHQGLLRNAQEYLSGGEISHCLMWGRGANGVGVQMVWQEMVRISGKKNPLVTSSYVTWSWTWQILIGGWQGPAPCARALVPLLSPVFLSITDMVQVQIYPIPLASPFHQSSTKGSPGVIVCCLLRVSLRSR